MSYLTGTTLELTGTNNITLGTTGTISTPLVYSDYNTNFNNPSLKFNSYNMAQTRQAKIAIFEVTRDKKTNEITSSKFLKELWVEVKNGISIDLVAAKYLRDDFDPETIVIREITSVYF